PHVGVVLTLRWTITKIEPTSDDLLWRAAADAQLETAARDEASRASVLRHVERVRVTHVDHCSAYFYAAGFRADGCQQRERRCKLTGKVMDAEERSIRTQLLGRNCKVDGLQ